MSFSPADAVNGGGSNTAVALGDLDADGDLDIVVVSFNGAEAVWLNNGSGGFSAHPTTPTFGAGQRRSG